MKMHICDPCDPNRKNPSFLKKSKLFKDSKSVIKFEIGALFIWSGASPGFGRGGARIFFQI